MARTLLINAELPLNYMTSMVFEKMPHGLDAANKYRTVSELQVHDLNGFIEDAPRPGRC
jgi:hypothetical protein